jgi:hypothetical protein
MGQHHVFEWWKHYRLKRAKVSATKWHIIIWTDLFELMIFTMVPSSVYNATIIHYNSYQEFRFKLHYINGTLESIWRG